MIGDSMPVTAYALTRRASLGGDQRVFRPNWGQPRPDGLFGRPRSALFEAQSPEKLGIVGAEPFTCCGDTENTGRCTLGASC